MKKHYTLSALFICLSFAFFAQISIAVLPYSISYSGNIPKKMTPEIQSENMQEESVNYQVAMINFLAKRKTYRKNRNLNISIMSQQQINALILEKNITAEKLTTLSNNQLAEILGVTYVVRGSITRTFIMSDELSLGLTAVSVLSRGQVPVITATSSISAVNSLENVLTSNVICSRHATATTSATYTDDQAMRGIFNRAAKRMFRILRRVD